jgi:hypothetical protein
MEEYGLCRIVKIIMTLLLLSMMVLQVVVAHANGPSSLDVKTLYSRVCAKYCVHDCEHAMHDQVPVPYLECAFGCMKKCIHWFKNPDNNY